MEENSLEIRVALLELANVANAGEIAEIKESIEQVKEEIDEINLVQVEVKTDLTYIRGKTDETSVKIDKIVADNSVSKTQMIWGIVLFVLGSGGSYLLTSLLGG